MQRAVRRRRGCPPPRHPPRQQAKSIALVTPAILKSGGGTLSPGRGRLAGERQTLGRDGSGRRDGASEASTARWTRTCPPRGRAASAPRLVDLHFDAAVQLRARLGLIGADQVAAAAGSGPDALRVHAGRDQRFADGIGALLSERGRLILSFALIEVALERDDGPGVVLQEARPGASSCHRTWPAVQPARNRNGNRPPPASCPVSCAAPQARRARRARRTRGPRRARRARDSRRGTGGPRDPRDARRPRRGLDETSGRDAGCQRGDVLDIAVSPRE